MKKIWISLLLIIAFSTQSLAFLYEVKMLTREEINKLSKEELVEIYTNVMVERKAAETFHSKAGFTPKEYQAFKELLMLIIRLREEMVARDIEAPPINEWLQ